MSENMRNGGRKDTHQAEEEGEDCAAYPMEYKMDRKPDWYVLRNIFILALQE
jgi:hypothetical protein